LGMDDVLVTLPLTLQHLLGTRAITHADLKEIQTILQGESVIDWPRLHYHSIPTVNEFLKVCQFDPDRPEDVARLADIHLAAVRYVRNVLNLKLPGQVAQPTQVQDLFLYASSRNAYSQLACLVLKVMLVVNHLEAGELAFHLPHSEKELFAKLDRRVMEVVNRMFALGFDLHEFTPSRKTEESLVTKLLVKKSCMATQVFDRIRFRLVTARQRDILPVLYYIKRNLVPFTYIIPGESTNTVECISKLFQDAFDSSIDVSEYASKAAFNRFTHRDFRVINFCAEIPIRVDDLVQAHDPTLGSRFGNIVFVSTEFQIFDRSSYYLNESGPAAHVLYKDRQVSEVLRRLYGHPDNVVDLTKGAQGVAFLGGDDGKKG